MNNIDDLWFEALALVEAMRMCDERWIEYNKEFVKSQIHEQYKWDYSQSFSILPTEDAQTPLIFSLPLIRS